MWSNWIFWYCHNTTIFSQGPLKYTRDFKVGHDPPVEKHWTEQFLVNMFSISSKFSFSFYNEEVLKFMQFFIFLNCLKYFAKKKHCFTFFNLQRNLVDICVSLIKKRSQTTVFIHSIVVVDPKCKLQRYTF